MYVAFLYRSSFCFRRAYFSSTSFHNGGNPSSIQAYEYQERRTKLLDLAMASVNDSTGRSGNRMPIKDYSPTVLLFSKRKTFSAPDVPHVFRQCSNFRYLSGFVLPETARLVFNNKESILFREEKSDNQNLWEGKAVPEDEVRKICGVDHVMPLSEFEAYMIRCLKTETILVMDSDTLKLEAKFDDDLRKSAQFFEGVSHKLSLTNLLDKLRFQKSTAEIDLIRKTCNIGSQTMNSVISQSASATNESHIVGQLEYEARRRGAQFLAYPPVVASGQNACTIHYISSNMDIKKSDCLLVDAGCDYDGYVSDITRCFPNSGQFSTTNRILYDALNFVQSNLLHYVANTKPLRLDKLYFYMMENMAAALGSIVFFKKSMSVEEMIVECDKLCPHHVSHYLGLDVHDTPTIPRNIEIPAGVVITVEPGIYVQESNTAVRDEFKNIGFRIEDDVLITVNGSEVLTAGCIRSSEQIEHLRNS